MNELAIAQPVHTYSGIEASNPEAAEVPLFPSAMRIGIGKPLLELIMGMAEDVLFAAPVAFRLAKDAPPPLPRSYPIPCPHSLRQMNRKKPHPRHIRRLYEPILPKLALTPVRFAGKVMTPARSLMQHLARSSDLEALLAARMPLHKWQKYSKPQNGIHRPHGLGRDMEKALFLLRQGQLNNLLYPIAPYLGWHADVDIMQIIRPIEINAAR